MLVQCLGHSVYSDIQFGDDILFQVHVGSLQEELTCGFHDSLQTPLQPLADHLESVTYEIFEKDPIKYTRYKEAFLSAFEDFRDMVVARKVNFHLNSNYLWCKEYQGIVSRSSRGG